MNWLKEWLLWLKAKILRLFGRKNQSQTSVVPPAYQSTGELNLPKQLGVGSPPASGDLLKELSEDIAKREAALDSKEVESRIEIMHADQKLRERELEARIANEQARLKFVQQQLEVKAEEMRRVQEREDETLRTQQQIELLQTEQEEARKSNDQAEAFRQKRREEKQQDRAAKEERRSQRWQAARKGTSQFFNGLLSNLWKGIKFSFRKIGEGFSVKWVKPILAAIALIGVGVWFFLTETGQQLLFEFAGWVEQNQRYIVSGLVLSLGLLLLYKYRQTVRPRFVLMVKSKAFWLILLGVALISGVIWLFSQNYFEGLGSGLASLVWPYVSYLVLATTVILVLVLWRWIKRSQARIQKLKEAKTWVNDSGRSVWTFLSTTTKTAWVITLIVLAIFGIYTHSWVIFLTALAWLPMCLGLKPSLSLSLRVIYGVVMQFTAITLGTVTLH